MRSRRRRMASGLGSAEGDQGVEDAFRGRMELDGRGLAAVEMPDQCLPEQPVEDRVGDARGHRRGRTRELRVPADDAPDHALEALVDLPDVPAERVVEQAL